MGTKVGDIEGFPLRPCGSGPLEPWGTASVLASWRWLTGPVWPLWAKPSTVDYSGYPHQGTWAPRSLAAAIRNWGATRTRGTSPIPHCLQWTSLPLSTSSHTYPSSRPGQAQGFADVSWVNGVISWQPDPLLGYDGIKEPPPPSILPWSRAISNSVEAENHKSCCQGQTG